MDTSPILPGLVCSAPLFWSSFFKYITYFYAIKKKFSPIIKKLKPIQYKALLSPKSLHNITSQPKKAHGNSDSCDSFTKSEAKRNLPQPKQINQTLRIYVGAIPRVDIAYLPTLSYQRSRLGTRTEKRMRSITLSESVLGANSLPSCARLRKPLTCCYLFSFSSCSKKQNSKLSGPSPSLIVSW